jgi:hypothetical protein
MHSTSKSGCTGTKVRRPVVLIARLGAGIAFLATVRKIMSAEAKDH